MDKTQKQKKGRIVIGGKDILIGKTAVPSKSERKTKKEVKKTLKDIHKEGTFPVPLTGYGG